MHIIRRKILVLWGYRGCQYTKNYQNVHCPIDDQSNFDLTKGQDTMLEEVTKPQLVVYTIIVVYIYIILVKNIYVVVYVLINLLLLLALTRQ